MDQILTEALKSAPEAAAILVVVFAFLRFLARRDKNLETQQERWFEAWKNFGVEQTKLVERSNGVIEKNSEVFGRISGVLEKINGGK